MNNIQTTVTMPIEEYNRLKDATRIPEELIKNGEIFYAHTYWSRITIYSKDQVLKQALDEVVKLKEQNDKLWKENDSLKRPFLKRIFNVK